MAIDTNEVRNCLDRAGVHRLDVIVLCDELDDARKEIYRLRAEAKPTPPPQEGKTVRVRVAVAVDKRGHWNAAGWGDCTDFQAASLAYSNNVRNDGIVFWLTATLPVPEEREIEAEVSAATNNETATSGGRE